MGSKNGSTAMIVRLPVRIRVTKEEGGEVLLMTFEEMLSKNLAIIEGRHWLDFGCGIGKKRETTTIQRRISLLTSEFSSFMSRFKSNKDFFYLDVDNPINQFYLCNHCEKKLFKKHTMFRKFRCKIGYGLCPLNMLNMKQALPICPFIKKFLFAEVAEETSIYVETCEGQELMGLRFYNF